MELNTHTHSPAWAPLKRLFIENVSGFLKANAGTTFDEKHLIGAAMWQWMLDTDLIHDSLSSAAEQVHFRPGKGNDGHPLWRIAFIRSVRNTPDIDALFVGKRKGPTPRYARLVAAGIVPPQPKDFKPESAESSPQPLAERARPDRQFVATREWVTSRGGDEWLYVYSTTRELDNHDRNGIVPMLKVGYTRSDYSARVAAQARGTAVNSPIIVLSSYRCADAQALEAAVHKALRLQGRHVKDAPGVEWFEIAPSGLHTLVEAITGGCSPLLA